MGAIGSRSWLGTREEGISLQGTRRVTHRLMISKVQELGVQRARRAFEGLGIGWDGLGLSNDNEMQM